MNSLKSHTILFKRNIVLILECGRLLAKHLRDRGREKGFLMNGDSQTCDQVNTRQNQSFFLEMKRNGLAILELSPEVPESHGRGGKEK